MHDPVPFPEAHGLLAALAPELGDALLMGSVGARHLGSLAEAALAAAEMRTQTLGRELLLAALTEDPLNGALVAQAAEAAGAGAAVAQPGAAHWRPPQDPSAYLTLVQARDYPATRDYLHARVREEPGNRYWLSQLLAHALFEGEAALAWETVQRTEGDDPLLGLARARVAFYAGELDVAEGQAREAGLALPGALVLLGEILLVRGRRDEAANVWRGCLTREPWRTSLILKLHDLATGVDRARRAPAPDGRLAVCLYTFNKAAEIDATLTSLAASRLYGAKLLVLDNGSTDATPEVLATWKDRLGEGLELITLPVNAGAPAARNWLLQTETARTADYLAYVDDDALLPPDWLERLLAALDAYPDAPVAGCRVVDAVNPLVLQAVDLHLRALAPATEGTAHVFERARHFRVSDLHHQVLDEGGFSALRPSVSVTGCCHLFRGGALREEGGFDLRFSPTQYDDLDHDLRFARAGRLPVYQGHLRVEHLKRSGKGGRTNPAAEASALANQFKLQVKYPPEAVQAILSNWREKVFADIEAKNRVFGSGR